MFYGNREGISDLPCSTLVSVDVQCSIAILLMGGKPACALHGVDSQPYTHSKVFLLAASSMGEREGSPVYQTTNGGQK